MTDEAFSEARRSLETLSVSTLRHRIDQIGGFAAQDAAKDLDEAMDKVAAVLIDNVIT